MKQKEGVEKEGVSWGSGGGGGGYEEGFGTRRVGRTLTGTAAMAGLAESKKTSDCK